MVDERAARLVVLVDPALKNTLARIAEANDRTLSDQVRHVLKGAIGDPEDLRELAELRQAAPASE